MHFFRYNTEGNNAVSGIEKMLSEIERRVKLNQEIKNIGIIRIFGTTLTLTTEGDCVLFKQRRL